MSVETGPNSHASVEPWAFFFLLDLKQQVRWGYIKQEISEAWWPEALSRPWAKGTFTSAPFMTNFPPGWSAPSWRRWQTSHCNAKFKAAWTRAQSTHVPTFGLKSTDSDKTMPFWEVRSVRLTERSSCRAVGGVGLNQELRLTGQNSPLEKGSDLRWGLYLCWRSRAHICRNSWNVWASAD